MQIPFELGDDDATLHWHAGRNRFEIEHGGEIHVVNTWWHPTQQISWKRRRAWSYELGGYHIEIEKVRPRIFPFARTNEVTVRVDGRFAAREWGT